MKHISLLLAAWLLLAQASIAQNLSTITVHIKGLKSERIFLLASSLNQDGQKKMDTIPVKGEHFSYQLAYSQPTELIIIPSQSVCQFSSGRKYIPSTGYMDLVLNGEKEIILTGAFDHTYLDYSISGSNINQSAALLRRTYKATDTQATALEIQNGHQPGDSAGVMQSRRLFHRRAQQVASIAQIKLSYIGDHPDQDLSGLLLLKLPLKIFGSYYPSLSDSVKNGWLKRALTDKYQDYIQMTETARAQQLIKAGNTAPDFILPDSSGKNVQLARYKDKHTLTVLDFWGSWCGWCIEEFPRMKQYYKKYHTQLNIIGIACNDRYTDWKKALEHYALPWLNLLNTGPADISVKYGINVFPVKIILNEHLKIIGIYKGAGLDFFQALDSIMLHRKDIQ